MDKIQELHIEVCNTAFVRRGSMEMSVDHATITEDLMGRFAEWVDTNGWVYMKSEKVFLNNEGPLTPKSTSELITMFKETL